MKKRLSSLALIMTFCLTVSISSFASSPADAMNTPGTTLTNTSTQLGTNIKIATNKGKEVRYNLSTVTGTGTVEYVGDMWDYENSMADRHFGSWDKRYAVQGRRIIEWSKAGDVYSVRVQGGSYSFFNESDVISKNGLNLLDYHLSEGSLSQSEIDTLVSEFNLPVVNELIVGAQPPYSDPNTTIALMNFIDFGHNLVLAGDYVDALGKYDKAAFGYVGGGYIHFG